MLKLHIHKRLSSVRKQWKRIEKSSSTNMSAYQSYYVNAVVKKRLFVYGFKEGYSARYLELREDGKPLMILPICKYRGTENYCSLGNFNGFQVYDFVYAQEMTIEKMRRCLQLILQSIQPSQLSFYNVPEYSLLYQSIAGTEKLRSGYTVTCQKNDNVCIDTENDYDLWYGKLSKSTRQNIRTAYNRMKTDDIQLRFESYRGVKLKRSFLNPLIELYCKRHEARYEVKTSFWKKLYLKYVDFSTACLRSYHDNFCTAVYMNEKPAAFMSGMVEKDGTSVVIPRLSINDDFSRYSPGVVLINETVRQLTSDTGVRILDLSKGAEGYKLFMGGKLYHTHNIVIGR